MGPLRDDRRRTMTLNEPQGAGAHQGSFVGTRRLGRAAEGCKVTPTIVDYLYAIAPRSASPAQASFGSPLPVRVVWCIAGPSSFAGDSLGVAVRTKRARTRRRASTRGGATRHRRS